MIGKTFSTKEKTRSFRHPAVYKYGRGQRFDVKVPIAEPEQEAQLPEQARGVVGEKDAAAMRDAYERGEMGGPSDDNPNGADDERRSSGESSVPSESALIRQLTMKDGKLSHKRKLQRAIREIKSSQKNLKNKTNPQNFQLTR